MIIHGHIPKSKKRKVPKAKQEQYQQWLDNIQSMSTNFSITKSKTFTRVTPLVESSYRRETPYIRSLDTGLTVATKKVGNVYTGTAMKGIATMHKSNAVPVFTDEHAVEISKMRRS